MCKNLSFERGGSASMNAEEIRKLQLKSLETLQEFAKFCDDNFLRYYIIGGCLIGAVREGGFLAWDDDIDVFMPRPDYERLWRMWNSRGRFKLLRTTDRLNIRSQFMTLCDSETTCVRRLTKDLPIPQGITMDIIPLDGAPYSRLSRMNQKRHAVLYSVYCLDMLPENHGGLSRFAARLLLMKPKWLKNRLRKRHERKMMRYNLTNCDYLTELCSGLKYMGNEYPKEWFTSTVPIKFEGMTLPAPVGYKKYLTAVFGNYMTPPDDSERTTDHGILFVDTERSYLDTLYGDE